MSEFSQPISTCSRTTDFSFVLNNAAFSDAVLVLLIMRPKGASISRRLISSVAQLWLSAAQVTASTVANTVAGAVPAGDALHAASKLLDKYGHEAVGWLAPKNCQELAIATVFQVNSALLAASSPYLRYLIQNPQPLQHLVPGLSSVAAANRQRKLLAVMVQPHHLQAAEAVVKFIFSNDIALTSAQDALHALLVAEQLQVPDCAEVCQHYLEDCAMDWQVALTLVHLQHKHQQQQHQERQQQWQQQQQQSGQAKGSAGSVASARLASSRPPVYQRPGGGPGLSRRSLGANSALDVIAPVLPVPSESVYLQGLLVRAQDFLVQQFEDLELVLGNPEGRQRLLLLPYDALRAILSHHKLKVASENTALLAAAAWLAANAVQAANLLLSTNTATHSFSRGQQLQPQQGAAAGPDSRSQGIYSSSLHSSSGGGDNLVAAEAATSGSGARAANGYAPQPVGVTAAGSMQQQQQPPPAESGVVSLLLDLCQVLRLCQLSYTYLMHVLPHLPLFKDQPGLVAALQFEVLRYKAAGELRQRRLAAAAAAEAAAAAAAAGLTGHALASMAAEQRQQHVGSGGAADCSSSFSSAGGAAASPTDGPGLVPPQAAATTDRADWGSSAKHPAAAATGRGWRGFSQANAALLQGQRRPESCLTALDFTFTFDPQALAGPEQGAAGRGSSAGGGSSNGGSSTGVDLMQRLLGLTPQQQQQPDTLLSEDHFFAGYVWNMVVAQDGFVGMSWRVVLPGGGEVQLAPPQHEELQAVAAGPGPVGPGGQGRVSKECSGAGSIVLFRPDCAGFRVPEVAVTFSITSSGLSRNQRSSSAGNGVAGAASAAGTSSSGGGAGTASSSSVADGASQQQQQQLGSVAAASSPMKTSSSSSKVKGVVRTYSEVQLVPARCAWGFPNFTGSGGWEVLKGPDGKVCLRCQLKHRE